MQLLSSTATAAEHGRLAERVPRLLPYFRHTLPSVRRSVLQCLVALLETDPSGDSRRVPPPCARRTPCSRCTAVCLPRSYLIAASRQSMCSSRFRNLP